MPLTADAGSAATAGTATVSVETSVSSSVESTVTTGTLDWTLGAAMATTSVVTTVAPVATRTPKSVRRIIAETGKKAGLSNREIDGLLWIAYRESRFHPWSKSKSGCYGLFQLSAGMAKGKPWRNAEWNTKRAIRYMKGRYGGVLQAKAFWQRHHWY